MAPKPLVIIAANGTLGDLLPATALGRSVAARGAEVHLLANETFRELATGNGVQFRPTGPADGFNAFIDGPAWKGEAQSWAAFLREGIMPTLEPTVAHIADLTAGGRRAVVVAFNYAYGARLAAQRLELPLINAYIQPGMFDAMSGHDGPAAEVPAAAAQAAAYGRAVRAAEDYVFRIFSRSGAGRTTAKPTATAWRDEQFLGLFPSWFAPNPRDWPSAVKTCGLPLIDTTAEMGMPEDVNRFLADGPPPVGLYCGSFMRDARPFFAAGIEACRALGVRALVVHRFAEDLPTDLPEGVLVARVVPFGQLMPRLCALIHQGGIGTTAQALAAGIGQITLPLRFDQAGNAAYMSRLGVGEVLSVDDGPEVLAARLHHVLHSDAVARACAEFKGRMQTDNPFDDAADAVLERLAQAVA